MTRKPLAGFLVFLVISATHAQITFPDFKLEMAVRQGLGIFSGPITSNDMASLQYLSASTPPGYGEGFRNLAGLEAAYNLEWLSLIGNPVTNAAPLASLTNLTYLNISQSTISNLTFIPALTRLESFDAMFHSTLRDVAPLNGLPTLQQCRLTGSYNITNLHVLTNLPSLWLLEAANVPLPSLDFVRHLPLLQSLEFGPSPVEDLSVLTNANLSTLGIYYGSATNWEVLQYLPLNALSIGNPLTPFTSIDFCTGLFLTDLRLLGTGVTNLAPLTTLPFLTRLELDFTPVTDFSAIAGLTNLQFLSLRNTGLKDTAWLNQLTNLSELLLIGGNNITNWVPLNLPLLQEFVAEATGLSDLSVVSGLSQLRYLMAPNNQITDLTPLATLTNLTYLYLPHNMISNVAPLLTLPASPSVHVDYNRIDMNTGTPGRTSLNQLRTTSFVNFRGQRYQPRLRVGVTPMPDGYDVLLTFDPCPGVTHHVERTTDFVTWTTLGFIGDLPGFPYYTPLNVHVSSEAQPAGAFFYRLRADYP